MKSYLIFLFTLISLIVRAQDVELSHSISSDQTYKIKVDENEKGFIYLHFYSPGIVDYKSLPYFLVSGWYEVNGDNTKNNLVGIYRPSISLVLFAPNEDSSNYIESINKTALNIDTTACTKSFEFSLNEKSEKKKSAIWYNGNQKTFIDNIDFDEKNITHRIFLQGSDLKRNVNRSIDITDFVISPFGDNDIFLEDYTIDIYSSFTDTLGSLHLLLSISNEYVIPSSLSSGGYYYLMLDENQIIRDNIYYETYNQGQYISCVDDDFIHSSKQRHLVMADWSDSKIIGSFFIENSRIEIEKEWNIFR